jgi:hypothetical protein
VNQAIEVSKREKKLVEAIEEGSSFEEIKKILSPEKW